MELPIFNPGYTLESPQELLKSLYSQAPLGPWSWVQDTCKSTVSQMWSHDPKRTKVESKPMAVETELNAYRKATLLSTGPAVTTQGTTSQPARARASPAFQHPHGHQPHHNRRMYTAHIGNIPRVKSSDDQKGMCCLGPRGGLLNKATSPRWET